MMFSVIGYTLAVAAALSVVGFCAERLAAMRGMARRYFWLLAMVLSIAWPSVMTLTARPESAARVVASFSPMPESASMAALPPVTATPAPRMAPLPGPDIPLRPVASGKAFDSLQQWVLPVWACASGALLLYLLLVGALLQRRAAHWRRHNVLGHDVLVSESTGPALLGALRPRIVVPHWFLNESTDAQQLILAHEVQHIAARDPFVLRLAQLLLVVAPWILPMWWQLHRLRLAIEMDCDARVLRAGAEAGAYGEVLLAVTRRAGSVPVIAIAMGEPVSALEQRIRNLLPKSARLLTVRTLAALVVGIGVIGAAVALEAPPMPTGATGGAQAAQLLQQTTDVDRDIEARRAMKFLQEQLEASQKRLIESDRQLKLAQQAAKQNGQQQAHKAVTPTPAGPVGTAADGTDLRDLISLAGARFKKRFVVDPRVRGMVDKSMLAPDSLSYHAFLATLGVNGFVAVPSGDVVTIIPEVYARSVASPIVSAEDIKGDDAEIVTVLIPVEGDSGRMFLTIQHLVPQWAVVESIAQNQILLVDRVANARRIVALVRAQSKSQ